jgi:thiamine biosynthesis lipoprotein
MTTTAGTLSSFAALGTTATILVADPDALAGAVSVLRTELDAIDLACSRFRPDSELAKVNSTSGRSVPVSPLFLEATEVALRAARATGGRVTPTVGSAMKVLGYDRDFATIDPVGSGVSVRAAAVPAWQVVEVDRSMRRVRVPSGVELDFGATAKALCADRAARAAAGRAGSGVLVSLGGDIAVAGSPPPGGWAIRVTHDHADPPDGPGQTVTITGGGLATSSTRVRRWERNGNPFHHVVDPATGLPAQDHWQTVTVAAGSCVDANIASTASIILGPSAPRWLQQRRLPARLVDAAGAETVLAGWPRRSEAD